MPCVDRIDHLNEFLDGTLDGPDRRLFFQHLAGCEDCGRFLAVMVKFKNLAARDEHTVPSSVDDGVLNRIVSASGVRAIHPRRTPVPEGWFRHQFSAPVPIALAGIAACIVAGILIGQLWFSTRPAVQETQTALDPFRNPSAVIVVYGIPPVDVVEQTHHGIIVPRQPIQY